MMLKFNLFDSEYGVGREIAIDPELVESVIGSEQRVYGARWFVATLTMTSGAKHTVTDNSKMVGDLIAEARDAAYWVRNTD